MENALSSQDETYQTEDEVFDDTLFDRVLNLATLRKKTSQKIEKTLLKIADLELKSLNKTSIIFMRDDLEQLSELKEKAAEMRATNDERMVAQERLDLFTEQFERVKKKLLVLNEHREKKNLLLKILGNSLFETTSNLHS